MTSGHLRRGDVVLTRFPFTDLSGSAVRPAVVVSQGQIADDVVLMAVSSVVRHPFATNDIVCDATHQEFAATGLKVTSVLRSLKLVAVETKVLTRRLGCLGPLLQAPR